MLLIPSNSGEEPENNCIRKAKFGRIELPRTGRPAQHHQGICFNADCTIFRRIQVLWCPPDEIGGEQKKEGKPFFIYKLKETTPGYAYCVK